MWKCFDALRIYCDGHHGDDGLIVAEMKQLRSTWSKFAADIREGAFSPYGGFRVSITAPRRLLDNDVDDDCWPKHGRR